MMAISLRRPAGLAIMLAIVQFVGACGGGDTPLSDKGGGEGAGGPGDDCPPGDACTACEPGERLVDDVCQAAGLPPDMPCPPGETLTEGACQAAGVPPGACAPGFEHDGDGGCSALLPAARCPSGKMALMGETICREVAPCGSAPFGNIISDNTTQFVDQAYAGGGGNGSQSKPWRTVQAGIAAAAAGATVAIAAGSYQEDLSIAGKTLTLWGRCPALVEVVGSAGSLAAIQVAVGAENTLVRGLAIRGDSHGVVSSGALGVRLKELWVHDVNGQGVHVDAAFGQSSLSLEDSLVESTVAGGGVSVGSELHIIRSVLRDVREGTQTGVAGVVFSPDDKGQAARGSVKGSLIEDNTTRGVLLVNADVIIDSSVIRGTRAGANGASQGGIVVSDAAGLQAGMVEVGRCLIHDNVGTGAFLQGGVLSIHESVIRDSRRDDQGRDGDGIRVLANSNADPSAGPSQLILTSCLIDQSAQLGIRLEGADATISATIVRNTAGGVDTGGLGIQATDDPVQGRRSTLTLDGSVFELNLHAALWLLGSDLAMHRSIIRENAPNTVGGFGLGVAVDMNLETGERSTLSMSQSLVEGNTGGGIGIWSGDATIRDSVIRDTLASSDDKGGIGLLGSKYPGGPLGSAIVLEGVLIERNHYAGLQFGGSRATVTGCQINDTLSLADGRNGHGIDVVTWYDDDPIATATVTSTVVARNRGIGLYVGGAKVELSASRIVDTQSNGRGEFGDGILVGNVLRRPAEVSLSRAQVDASERAGISNFGSLLSLRMSALRCQLFDFDAEPSGGLMAVFEDGGGNVCGCPKAATACKQVSAKLQPPQPILPPGAPGGDTKP